MINALVNRNPQPTLVKFGYAEEPLFAPDYDWEEQRRVRTAFTAITREESPELWEQMLKHLNDQRYAITMRNNGPNASNYSVGDLCKLVTSARLLFASAWHSDPDSHDRNDVWLNLGVNHLARWRAERAEKNLCELQIEICERALVEVDRMKDKDLPARAKPPIREKLRAWVNELRRTKRPLFFRPLMDGFEYFNAAQAKRLREKRDKEMMP
jgi:hypothetical protein